MLVQVPQDEKILGDLISKIKAAACALHEHPAPLDAKYLNDYESALSLLDHPEDFAKSTLGIGKRGTETVRQRGKSVQLISRPSYSIGKLRDAVKSLCKADESEASLKGKAQMPDPALDPDQVVKNLESIFNHPQKQIARVQQNWRRAGIPSLLVLMVAEGVWWHEAPRQGGFAFCAMVVTFAALCNVSKLSTLASRKVENETRNGGWDRADEEMIGEVARYSKRLQEKMPLARAACCSKIDAIKAHQNAEQHFKIATSDLATYAYRRNNGRTP